MQRREGSEVNGRCDVRAASNMRQRESSLTGGRRPELRMRDGGEGGEDHEAHRGLSSRRLLDAIGKPMAREAEGKSALILAALVGPF